MRSKKSRFFSAVIQTLIIACVLILPSLSARAQVFLDMNIAPPAQTATAGSSPVWDVILTNNTGGAVTLNLTAFSPGFPLTPDVDVSVGLLPVGTISLSDGQSFVLNDFLTTVIHSGATSSIYDALAEMTYNATDADGNDFLDLTASADWQLTVRAQPTGGAVAPEPATISLMLLALPFISLPLRKRR